MLTGLISKPARKEAIAEDTSSERAVITNTL
jgi:hypothetical protein